MKIFHQLGFREKWNFEVYNNDQTGDGFILSPVNYPYNKLIKLDSKINEVSILDPQYFLPEKAPKGKLDTYPYFAKELFNKETLETKDFFNNGNECAIKIAEECIKLQIEQNYSRIIIPFKKSHEVSYDINLKKQEDTFVRPFLKYLEKHQEEKPIYITLILEEKEVIYEDIRNYILNWITKFDKVSGVYLIFENSFNTKQIKNSDYLFNALCFINFLKENELNVIIGYTNTEAIIYSLAFPEAVTLGSYENLRKFSYDRFIEKEDNGPRMPKARLYSDKLLNWIPHGHIESIQDLKEDYGIFQKNKYYPEVFHEEFNWHFTKPQLYKHYFLSFSNQLKNLGDNRAERFKQVKLMIKDAYLTYSKLEDNGILFGVDCDSSHLQPWFKAVQRFEEYIIEEEGSL